MDMLLCLAGMIAGSALLRTGDDLAGVLLPLSAPLHSEAGEAVPVQVAQLTVGHQPPICPSWHFALEEQHLSGFQHSNVGVTVPV